MGVEFKAPQGAKGDTGIGVKGDTGAKGETGLKGDTGAKGETGLKGDTGAKGDTGLKGDTGAKGNRGEAGTGLNLKTYVSGQAGQKYKKGDYIFAKSSRDDKHDSMYIA